MLIDTYTMIVPQKNTFEMYEHFYSMYGNIVRNSILNWKLLDESKDILPNIFIEMTQNMRRNEKQLQSSFSLIGLEYNAGKRQQYEKSIENTDIDEITKYFNNNLDLYIEYITNKQQFLNLYIAFEGSIRSYLKENYGINECKQEDLIIKIIENEIGFGEYFEQVCNISFSEEQFKNIWNYYTSLRNLYSHSGGYIGKKFIDTINGIKKSLMNFIDTDEAIKIEISLFLNGNTDLFQFSLCKGINKGKLFTISEYNLRFFRNFIVHIWESIYIKKVPNVIVKRNYKIEKNIYTFYLAKEQKESDLLQKKEQNLTLNNPCFNISGYMCPKCQNIRIFLYKAKFIPNIDVSYLLFSKPDTNFMARNVFTCPFCRSFFFPMYQRQLSENNGFNLLNLNEIDYENILDLFESKADINYGWTKPQNN